MKQIIILLTLALSISVHAQENISKNEAAIELANSMGMERLLNATLAQTKNSLKEQSASMIQQITKSLPKLTGEQFNELKEILNEYNASVLNSINTKTASEIYTTALSKGLTAKEIIDATSYYKSAEGQKMLVSVNEAARVLNTYYLSQMGASAKKAIPAMMNKLKLLRKKITQNTKHK